MNEQVWHRNNVYICNASLRSIRSLAQSFALSFFLCYQTASCFRLAAYAVLLISLGLPSKANSCQCITGPTICTKSLPLCACPQQRESCHKTRGCAQRDQKFQFLNANPYGITNSRHLDEHYDRLLLLNFQDPDTKRPRGTRQCSRHLQILCGSLEGPFCNHCLRVPMPYSRLPCSWPHRDCSWHQVWICLEKHVQHLRQRPMAQRRYAVS